VLSVGDRPKRANQHSGEPRLANIAKTFEQDSATPRKILQWAARAFPTERIAATASFSDTILIEHISENLPQSDIVFLNTGLHFAETLGTRDAAQQRYPHLNFVTIEPEQTVSEQAQTEGARLWETNPTRCCNLRKVKPLSKILENYDVWITGVRRTDHPSRADTPAVAWHPQHKVVKINPLAFTNDRENNILGIELNLLINPLRQIGYDSIGCEPCTIPSEGREGRWDGLKVECGLHV